MISRTLSSNVTPPILSLSLSAFIFEKTSSDNRFFSACLQYFVHSVVPCARRW
ncbi:hypothetical protein Fmac_011371 [Flemingia macrophylla]|uniref:Uncharacterized protein n=1 Tax=Flemingia macrophylla TaxID=520843 RepID=A0ABD1MMA1_9FABA